MPRFLPADKLLHEKELLHKSLCAALSTTVSHPALKVLPEQFTRLPQILRQAFQGFQLQLLRHPVKGFGDAAGNAGKGIAVAAEGDRIAERIFKAGAFQKGDDTALPKSQCPMASQAAVSSCSPAA